MFSWWELDFETTRKFEARIPEVEVKGRKTEGKKKRTSSTRLLITFNSFKSGTYLGGLLKFVYTVFLWNLDDKLLRLIPFGQLDMYTTKRSSSSTSFYLCT